MDTADSDVLGEIEATGARLQRARDMIARRIIGQEKVVEETLIAMLCGGHALLVGAAGPGQDPAGGHAGHGDGAEGAIASSSRPT
jgi:hypothetical protein